MKAIALLILTIYTLAMAAGCRHTAHGFGEDMEKAGQKIEKKTE